MVDWIHYEYKHILAYFSPFEQLWSLFGWKFQLFAVCEWEASSGLWKSFLFSSIV